MSKYNDPIGQATLDIRFCVYCQKDTEQHRYLVKGMVCKVCNN